MKFSELKGKTKDQLAQMVLDFKKESLNLRFQKSTGELANTSRFREVRRAIARIKTLLKQQQA